MFGLFGSECMIVVCGELVSGLFMVFVFGDDGRIVVVVVVNFGCDIGVLCWLIVVGVVFDLVKLVDLVVNLKMFM